MSNRSIGLQFEQGEVGVAIVCPIFTLLRHVVLKDGGGFGIITVEAIKYGFDMLGPVRRIVESYAHDDVAES